MGHEPPCQKNGPISSLQHKQKLFFQQTTRKLYFLGYGGNGKVMIK